MHVCMCYLCRPIKKSIVHVVHGPGGPAIKGLQLWLMKGFSLLMTVVTLPLIIVTLRILMQNIKFAIRINLDYDLDA